VDGGSKGVRGCVGCVWVIWGEGEIERARGCWAGCIGFVHAFGGFVLRSCELGLIMIVV